MTTIIVLLVLAIVVLAVLLWIGRGHRIAIQSLQDIQTHVVPVDLPALMNLFDPRNDAFLRSRLTRSQYARIRRERNRVGMEYVGRIAENAAILLRANYYARLHSADEAVKAEAGESINLALRIRTAALNMLVLLYLRTLIPNLGDPVGLGQRYQTVLNRTLSCFQRPQALSA